jgi:excisionase family DNA binding protein
MAEQCPLLMTRCEAASLLGVRPQTLAAWASTKRYPLPYVKVGRLVRYRRDDLLAFLSSRTISECSGDHGLGSC